MGVLISCQEYLVPIVKHFNFCCYLWVDGWIFAFFSSLKENDYKQFATSHPSKQTLVPETLIPETLASETLALKH